MSRSNDFEHHDLAVKAIQGDAEAFEQLYLRYATNILYHARRFVKDLSEAEDAAQESVIEMYRNIGTLKDPDAFLPWMYRLTKFVCLKHIRNLEAKRGGNDIADIDDYTEILADEKKESDPAKSIVENENAEAIRGVIERLPDKQRESLILFYYEGLSYREIAAALGSSPSTVSTNIMKAKKRIALELEPAIALAITADAGAKLAGISVPAFQAACKVGLVKSTAAGFGYGAVTSAGKYAAHGLKALSASGNILTACVLVAAATTITASVAAAAAPPVVPVIPEAPPIVVQAPAETYLPNVEISFSDGDCACGHVNPQTAAIFLEDDTDLTESWEISSGGAVVSSGEGETAQLSGLPDGDYTIRFVVASADGRKAHATRDFLITSAPFKEGKYL
jgi:RNA polymerase sigma-70 factor (ECF subfamily)